MSQHESPCWTRGRSASKSRDQNGAPDHSASATLEYATRELAFDGTPISSERAQRSLLTTFTPTALSSVYTSIALATMATTSVSSFSTRPGADSLAWIRPALTEDFPSHLAFIPAETFSRRAAASPFWPTARPRADP